VVDDEPDARMVAVKTLRKAGFEILEASSGEKAVETFRRRQADIACSLLDMSMPGMSGVQTFEALRAIDPQAKAVMLSGFSREDASSLFGADGLAGFVQKPFLPKELAAKVRAALEA
jgi:CheY-like chemotaxis protein